MADERIIEIKYNKWYVDKESDTKMSYEYWPETFYASMGYRVVIELVDGEYQSTFDSYHDLIGEWSEWKHCEDTVKKILLKDAKREINKKPEKQLKLWKEE